MAVSSLLMWASTASAEIYRYADEKGEMHAVSDLSLVPQQYRDAAIADAQQRSGGSLNIEGGEGSEAPAAKAPAAAVPQAAAPEPALSPDSAGIGGHDRLWWQTQALERQKKVDSLKSQLELAQTNESEYANQIYRKPGAARAGKPGAHPGRRRHPAARAAALDDDDETYIPSIEELERSVAEAERDLEGFHDQARTAGVPPGWLR
jgi:hypothetical protein